MNHYYLLFGPAMGFILGVFFAWFLMYSRMRLVEKAAADEKAELKKEIADSETLRNELATGKARIDESRATIDRLQMQLDSERDRLKEEMQKRTALEEKASHAGDLEEKINRLTDETKELAAVKARIKEMESAGSSLKKQFDNERDENSQLRDELKSAANRYDSLAEKLRDLATLRERCRKLEQENANMLHENQQLRNFESQLNQINEIKEIYNRTLEENQNLRNQDIARHLLAMKDGLQQSIKAFNSVMRMADNPLLTEAIEIQPAGNTEKIISPDSSQSEPDPSLSVEEHLDSMPEDTTELDKFEGVE